ncbi:MAG: hypothetical protein A2Z47_11850 [Thermodesulfovibrio sp. RBG_19FT_COMBO_42_12]|nr:MAG: hypothetical protein A2Z47_11850 [Thermodesulfovibrio sp. RBG_19FT_COMBO_42_12]
MVNSISSLARRALRVLHEEGWKTLYKKTKRKIKPYVTHEFTEGIKVLESGVTMHYPDDVAEKWLRDNRNNFSNAFYILLKYLASLNKQLKDIAPVSCDDYVDYFRERYFINNFPFEITSDPVNEKENIIEFINKFDYAYLDKMICSVFISLIRFLVNLEGNINLLDFGSGQTCGMYGENGRFLFKEGNVNIDAVKFFAIDDIHEPHDSIFRSSTYLKCNILSFHTEKKFDIITGHHVLEHCHNWEDVVRHVSKLLKHGGYLYLSFPRFGGFYDTVYRLMSPLDHCANFDLNVLKSFSESIGLEMCLSDIYVDPNNRFDWIYSLHPKLTNKKIAAHFYDLCVNIDSKLLLGYHDYGHYVVFRKTVY